MVGADADVPYDRPNLSKDYLAGTAPEEWIPLRPREFYDEHKIDLRTGTRVTAIDARKRVATLADGKTIAWEALLLATGAEPVTLAVPGGDKPHVHTLRSLADSRSIIARRVAPSARWWWAPASSRSRRRRRCARASSRSPSWRPTRRRLRTCSGPRSASSCAACTRSTAWSSTWASTVKSIGDKDVVLSDGTRIEADLVVVGIGVRPVTALAESAGLAIDRGIKVDAHLATSVAGIYAAGDAARFPDPVSGEAVRIEHWVVAQRMGQTVARNILGQRQTFAAAPFFWSVHYDLQINYVGHAERWDRIDIHGRLGDRDCTIAYRVAPDTEREQTLAVATIGRDKVSLAAETAFEKHDRAALREFGRKI